MLIPLSGGHDSRLIFKLLKMNNPKASAIVYNYGDIDEQDYIFARKAFELISNSSDRFIHIRYRDVNLAKKFRNILPNYALYSSKGVSCPCVSELCAIMELKEQLDYNRKYVAIPGYGGVVTGLYYKIEYFKKNKYTIEEVINILKNTFVNPRRGNGIDENLYRYIDSITDKKEFNRNEMLYVLQQYTFEEEQAKFIQNATQNFNYYGIEWFTPYMTKTILETWGTIDPQLIIGDYIFRELEKKIFSKEEMELPYCGSKENSYGRRNKFGRFTKYIFPRKLSKYDLFIPIKDHYRNLIFRRADGINAYVLYKTIDQLKKVAK